MPQISLPQPWLATRLSYLESALNSGYRRRPTPTLRPPPSSLTRSTVAAALRGGFFCVTTMFVELPEVVAEALPTMRTCTACKVDKPLAEFPRVQRWHRKVCHPCHLANRRTWRNQRADRVRAVQREYARSARGRETGLEAVRRYQARNPQKIAAQSALRYAIYRGDVVRPEQCEALGCDAPAHHGHHHDYSRPLDVVFLCRGHHEATHHVGPQRLKPAPGRRRKFARAPADGHRDGAQRADGGRGAGTTLPAVVGSAACQPVPPVQTSPEAVAI